MAVVLLKSASAALWLLVWMLEQLAERGQAGGVFNTDAALAIGGQLSWLPTNTGHMRKHRKNSLISMLMANKVLLYVESKYFSNSYLNRSEGCRKM